MINTVNTKLEQLRNSYYKVGSGSEVILIVGSCRTVPYMNYLNEWNAQNGNNFTIAFIDPFNFNYDLDDSRIDLEEKINSLETNAELLAMLKSVKIIVHEYYSNFGMFNFDKSAAKNIYQFGLNAAIDICIPNWNDIFILFGDIAAMDLDIRKKATQDFNVLGRLSEETFNEMCTISHAAIDKFKKVCALSDIPEMWRYFEENFRIIRFAHNSNHVTKHFTLFIFDVIMTMFLKLPLTDKFSDEISRVDMYDNSFTPLTNYDVACHNYQWNEPITSLKDKL